MNHKYKIKTILNYLKINLNKKVKFLNNNNFKIIINKNRIIYKLLMIKRIQILNNKNFLNKLPNLNY